MLELNKNVEPVVKNITDEFMVDLLSNGVNAIRVRSPIIHFEHHSPITDITLEVMTVEFNDYQYALKQIKEFAPDTIFVLDMRESSLDGKSKFKLRFNYLKLNKGIIYVKPETEAE